MVEKSGNEVVMFQAIGQFFHGFKHPFIKRQLVWKAVNGGGMDFGLGCVECGEIEWIDYYRGMELKSGREAVHENDFIAFMSSDEDAIV